MPITKKLKDITSLNDYLALENNEYYFKYKIFNFCTKQNTISRNGKSLSNLKHTQRTIRQA